MNLLNKFDVRKHDQERIPIYHPR